MVPKGVIGNLDVLEINIDNIKPLKVLDFISKPLKALKFDIGLV